MIRHSALYFFYTSNTPPKEILLNTEPQDINILKSLLENKVSIKIPLKGKKRMILKMVEENVDASFEKRKKEKFKTNELLNSIKLKFALKYIPKRIEIYDNSHLSGSNPTGAMVVFENGAFGKNSYRKFNIVCENNDDVIKIDSRTSDAIALSIRFNIPIFVKKDILDEAGFDDDEKYSEEINLTDNNFFKDENSDKSYKKSKDIKKISTNNIKKMLENSLQNEDYEMAAKLRDELNSRKSIK